jgi:hypothetical protein
MYDYAAVTGAVSARALVWPAATESPGTQPDP